MQEEIRVVDNIPSPAIIPVGTSIYHEGFISIMSYNILLPNSVDGWWVYKMYSHRHAIPANQTTWDIRKGLLQKEIAAANCDIVCFQEVSADSFESDFAFMKDLGYDQSEMYKKGRFRPATFWKSSRVVAVGAPMHRDRILVIPFKSIVETKCDEKRKDDAISVHPQTQCLNTEPLIFPELELPFYVANCHLQAGEYAAERRLRQMHDALESIRKDASKPIQTYLTTTNKLIASVKKSIKKRMQRHEEKPDNNQNKEGFTCPELNLPWAAGLSVDEIVRQLPIVIVGDMNCDPCDTSAAHALLVYGEATANGRVVSEEEDTKLKVRKQKLGNFIDAYDWAYADKAIETIKLDPPPTMICEYLYGVLTNPIQISNQSITNNNEIDASSMENCHELSELAEINLTAMFRKFATMKILNSGDTDCEFVMSVKDIKIWLETINLASNRGTEMRHALEKMIMPSSGCERCGADLTEFPENEEGYLDWSGFRSVYERAVNDGKVWSVSWDMAACGFPVNPMSSAVFSARYDRAYVSLGWIQSKSGTFEESALTSSLQEDDRASLPRISICAVSDLGVGNVDDGCLGVGGCLPNKDHPSDHLPISLALRI